MDDRIDFLRRGYEALQRGDLDGFKVLAKERLGPDFEFHHVWDGRVFKGYEGTLEWLSDTSETWEEYQQDLDEITAFGDDIPHIRPRRWERRAGRSGVRGGLDLRRRAGRARALVRVARRGPASARRAMIRRGRRAFVDAAETGRHRRCAAGLSVTA